MQYLIKPFNDFNIQNNKNNLSKTSITGISTRIQLEWIAERLPPAQPV